MSDLPKPASWDEAKQLAVRALEDNLAFLRRTLPGKRLTDRPQRADLTPSGLVCDTTVGKRVQWTDQQYFLTIGNDYERVLENRCDLHLSRFVGQRLFFKVPPATAARLRVRGAGVSVRAHYIDDTDVQLKTHLLAVLKRIDEGPLVSDLWGGATVMPVATQDPFAADLNEGQKRAFAAMTGGGGFFVWGPPGTGKTKVISAAVRRALRDSRTVLVTAHTHVAVDNVLEKLAGAGLAVGSLIRVASDSTRDKVSKQVKSAGTLLLDDAAAAMMHHHEHLEAIKAKERDLQSRTEFAINAVTQLTVALGGIDSAAVTAAEAAVYAEGRLPLVRVDLQRLQEEETTARAELDSARAFHRCLPPPDTGRRSGLQRQEHGARKTAVDIQQALSKLLLERERLASDRSGVQAGLLRSTEDERRVGVRARLFGEATRRRKRSVELAEVLNRVELRLLECTDEQHRAEACLAQAQASQREARAGLERLHREVGEYETAQRRLADAEARHTGIQATLSEVRADAAVLEERAGGAARGAWLLREVDRRGLAAALAERDARNSELEELAREERELVTERRKLDDELARTKEDLLAHAPVIACTLAGLASQRALLQRMFDIVVVDEVANASAPQVLLAASRATTSVALVGDFLQNAPIAETDDPVGDAGEVSVAWQREDIFALAGITDRDSAMRHSHCIALSRQYRYPSVVADIVNSFCYDGLLESHRPSTVHDGPTVTFVDTAQMANYSLRGRDGSWFSPGGLELLLAIARYHQGEELGFVCPYRPQAELAGQKTGSAHLKVRCGTSHAFQGQEVAVLVFDLMQDRRPRWVGAADLSGNRRAVSAAKLLNVALTRMQQRIYLLGDWTYVQSGLAALQQSPRAGSRGVRLRGMDAIAVHRDHPNFRVISALEVLSGGGLH